MHSYLVSHAVTVLVTLAALAVATGLVDSRRTSQSSLAWLLAIAFVPFIAIPLFLLLGRRKFPVRASGQLGLAEGSRPTLSYGEAVPEIARVLQTSGVAPPCGGNSFELLATGEVAYERLLDLVGAATQTIDLTMFILGDDDTGSAIMAALAARAVAGVSVRVILDGVGSSPSIRRAEAVLKGAGVELRIFMPWMHSPVRGRTNLRSHRKLAVFDGVHVFTGGMNLATEYMGPPGVSASGKPRWRDVAAVSSGPVAADASAMFESDWAFCGGARRKVSHPRPAAHGEAVLQVVPSGPEFDSDTVYDVFLAAIFAARERITLVTPYYIPDDALQHAVLLASRRGVRVEIVVPAISNHRIADVARRALLRELTAAHVQVRYYPRGMVHAKAMVVDDAFAYVGSPNFDMRSLFLNYENALCVYSPAAIASVRGFVLGLLSECDENGPARRPHRLWEQVARFLAPEL